MPRRSSASIVADCTPGDLLERYHPTVTETGVVALLPYQDPLVRACITEAKFYANRRAQILLGTVLKRYLTEKQSVSHVLVPIPLSPERFKKRGYNQVIEIIKQTPPLRPTRALLRTRNTIPQTQLDRAARQSNLQDAFALKSPPTVLGCQLILIDDVATTGATLLAAAAELQKAKPATLQLLALAH